MSQLFVDNIKNRTGGAIGAPSGAVVTGIVTATGGSFSGNVSVGGVLTYEDVTNIDSVGIITARTGIDVTGGHIDLVDNSRIKLGAGDDLQIYHDGSNSVIKDNGTGKLILDTDGAAIEFQKQGLETIATFNSDGAVELYHDNSKKLETTATGLDVTGTVTMDAVAGTNTNSALPVLFQTAAGVIEGGSGLTYNPGGDVLSVNGNHISINTFRGAGNAGTLNCANGAGNYDVRTSSTNVLLVSGGTTRVNAFATGVKLGPGALIEDGDIDTTARNGTQNVDFASGMVVYYSTASTASWKPNFRVSSSVSVNSVMAINDIISPTLIVAKGATTHFANAIQVDGSNITPEFLGGAPTDGGGSGTFDIYSYTIIKTGNAAFKVFASVSNYE